MRARSIVRELTVLAQHEARALGARDLAKSALIGEQMKKLAAALESALRAVGERDANALAGDLRVLQARCSENTAQLMLLRDGVARAKARLAAMAAAASAPGVYGERGVALRGRSGSALGKRA